MFHHSKKIAWQWVLLIEEFDPILCSFKPVIGKFNQNHDRKTAYLMVQCVDKNTKIILFYL